jgi:hypothetical protein
MIMNKIEILPKVVVYRNVLSEKQISDIVDVISKSEDDISSLEFAMPEDSAYEDKHGPQPKDRQDGSLIQTWCHWYTFGARSKFSNKTTDITDQNQLNARQSIFDALNIVHKDYSEEWKGVEGWPEYVEYFDLNIGSMYFSDIEILKHRINTDSEFTIGVHTDWHEQRSEHPGPKQIITYTIYLNDDYGGGEVDFVNEKDRELITYKPRRGDITVFPSGRPYWHAARAASSGNNKLFLRVFAGWNYEGSNSWKRGVEEYGLDAWTKMESERVKDFVDNGNVGRQIVFVGEEPIESKNLLPIFVERQNVKYIDGRNI